MPLIAMPPLEEPIRAELFGIERLEQHAESLAAAQPVMRAGAKGRRLLPRVQDTGRVLPLSASLKGVKSVGLHNRDLPQQVQRRARHRGPGILRAPALTPSSTTSPCVGAA
jgi:hypothetical protein